MRDPFSGGPTQADLNRMLRARHASHARLAGVNQARQAIALAAFREELGSTIRLASPLLIAMLESCGTSLDECMLLMKPDPLWMHEIEKQRYMTSHARPRITVDLASGGLLEEERRRSNRKRRPKLWCQIEARGHVLEMSAQLGNTVINSHQGRIDIIVQDQLPSSILQGCIGKPVRRLIDFPFFHKRRWPITHIEEEFDFEDRTMISVATGSSKYRMPWARAIPTTPMLQIIAETAGA